MRDMMIAYKVSEITTFATIAVGTVVNVEFPQVVSRMQRLNSRNGIVKNVKKYVRNSNRCD